MFIFSVEGEELANCLNLSFKTLKIIKENFSSVLEKLQLVDSNIRIINK